MSILDPKPLTPVSAAAQAADPATTFGAALSATILDQIDTVAADPAGPIQTAVVTATEGKTNVAAIASFSTLKAGLAEGARSMAVQLLGDSTGNETTEWFYKFANAMRTNYPGWTVHYKLWDDAAQNYLATTVLQTGTAGVRSISNAVGTTTRRLDPTVSTNITGVIDARVKLSLSDWTPGAQVNLGGRSGGAGFRGWYMFINTAGVPGFVYSVDGTALTTVFGTATAGIADGGTTWLRYLFTPDDGAGNRVTKFYKSTDNVTWTQVGATVTTAGAVTVNQPVWGYELGGVAGGAIATTAGTVNIYEVEIRNGENGPNVVPALPDLWPPYDLNAIRSSGAPVLTFVNGSKPGGDSAYLGDAVRLPKLTPAYGQAVTMISNSHNEGLAMDKVWLDKYETLRQAVETRLPGSSTVILTQNPETSGTTWYREHRARRLNLLGYARAKGVDIIDSYRAFLDYGAVWETDLMADAVHPNPAGSDLWAATVREAFDATA